MDRMRIVYVLNSLAVGGAERQVLALAARMRSRGHSVAIMVLLPVRRGDLETDLDVLHLDIAKSPAGLLRALRRGSRFLRDFSPDLLHSHNFHGNILARLLSLLPRRPRLICTIHNVYEGGWHRMLAYGLTDGLADRTTAVSRAVAKRYLELHAVSAPTCAVLTNGIDVAQFTPDPQRRTRMREQMGVTDQFVWIAIGRMAAAKDYPNLVRAMGKAWPFHPALRLWIVGDSSPEGRGKASYELAVSPQGTLDRVQMLGLRHDLPALLDAADGFVLSSAWEGMPLALGEAMAMQKPCVATDVGGVRELAGAAALIVPPRDPGALAEAMLGTMNASPESRAARGCSARERICTQFSMDARTAEWESLYSRVLA